MLNYQRVVVVVQHPAPVAGVDIGPGEEDQLLPPVSVHVGHGEGVVCHVAEDARAV